MGAGVIAFGLWAGMNRPVTDIAPYHGPIGGFAFSPFHRGESPETNDYPTTAEIKADLTLAAQHTKNIRIYTVGGDLGQIPALAEGMGLNVTVGAWLDRHPDANAAELANVGKVTNANPCGCTIRSWPTASTSSPCICCRTGKACRRRSPCRTR